MKLLYYYLSSDFADFDVSVNSDRLKLSSQIKHYLEILLRIQSYTKSDSKENI